MVDSRQPLEIPGHTLGEGLSIIVEFTRLVILHQYQVCTLTPTAPLSSRISSCERSSREAAEKARPLRRHQHGRGRGEKAEYEPGHKYDCTAMRYSANTSICGGFSYSALTLEV